MDEPAKRTTATSKYSTVREKGCKNNGFRNFSGIGRFVFYQLSFAKKVCETAREAEGSAVTLLTHGQLWARAHHDLHCNSWHREQEELQVSVLVPITAICKYPRNYCAFNL